MTTPDETPEQVDPPADDAAQTLAEAADLPQDIGAEELGTEDAAEGDDQLSDEVFGDVAPATVFAPIDRPVQTVGRRKEAVVRVRLVAGSGRLTMNGKPFEEYFPNKVHQQLIREPLVTTERTEQFDIYATLSGGGTSGQAGALRLAIARALTEIDPDDRPGLKKARKAPQYSKR